MRPVVLLTHTIHPEAMALLRGAAELRVLQQADEVGLQREIVDADALLVRMPVSPAAIRAGKKLRVVARHGVGLDYIPVDICSELGIPVTFTPDANTESVAEHVVGGMIALAHRMAPLNRAVHGHDWASRDRYLGIDLFGRTLGVIGLGRIGSRITEIAVQAFDMSVLGHDPHAGPDAAPNARRVPLENLLRQSDFVTLHVPLTQQTRHLLDAQRIGQMKRGAFLINAARGGLVETTALAAALTSGHLAGAALDVLEDEPPRADNPLIGRDNVIITPHSAALTDEAMYRMGMTAAKDIIRVLRGEPAVNQANRVGHERR